MLEKNQICVKIICENYLKKLFRQNYNSFLLKLFEKIVPTKLQFIFLKIDKNMIKKINKFLSQQRKIAQKGKKIYFCSFYNRTDLRL